MQHRHFVNDCVSLFIIIYLPYHLNDLFTYKYNLKVLQYFFSRYSYFYVQLIKAVHCKVLSKISSVKFQVY